MQWALQLLHTTHPNYFINWIQFINRKRNFLQVFQLAIVAIAFGVRGQRSRTMGGGTLLENRVVAWQMDERNKKEYRIRAQTNCIHLTIWCTYQTLLTWFFWSYCVSHKAGSSSDSQNLVGNIYEIIGENIHTTIESIDFVKHYFLSGHLGGGKKRIYTCSKPAKKLPNSMTPWKWLITIFHLLKWSHTQITLATFVYIPINISITMQITKYMKWCGLGEQKSFPSAEKPDLKAIARGDPI